MFRHVRVYVFRHVRVCVSTCMCVCICMCMYLSVRVLSITLISNLLFIVFHIERDLLETHKQLIQPAKSCDIYATSTQKPFQMLMKLLCLPLKNRQHIYSAVNDVNLLKTLACI